MSRTQPVATAEINAPQDYLIGLIGYTVGGIPVPFSKHEMIHKSILDEMSSNGERPLELFFEKDVERFKQVIAAYHDSHSSQRAINKLPRWTITSMTEGSDIGADEAPAPPSKNARTA